MKNLTKIALFQLVFFHSYLFLSAQTKTIENVLRVQLRNTGQIIKDNTVSGYYMFYQVDKVDRHNNSYLLSILDENLNEIASETLVQSKYLSLREATYDNESIMLKFFDFKKKLILFYTYDKNAKLKASKTIPLSKLDYYLDAGAGKEEIKNTFLFSSPQKGFFNYSRLDNKHWGYDINHFNSDGNSVWSYKSDPKAKENESAIFLATGKTTLLNSITKRPKINSTDEENYVLGLDIETGAKLFEKKLEDNNFNYQVFSGFENEADGSIVTFGLYYNKDDKMLKAKSLGLFTSTLDREGNFISTKRLTWDKDISKFLPINGKGKIDKMGYLYFHKIFRAADGKVYAIAEEYNKVVSGAGVALTAAAMVLGGRQTMSLSKMAIEDLVVFELDKNFSLENVKIIDKSRSAIELPAGAGYSNPQVLAMYIKALDGFDYSFTQLHNDKTNFSICYTDYDKTEKKREWRFFAVTHFENQYAVDKISLKTEATLIHVLPAKPGNVLLIEYFRKQKKLNMRLEKINY